MTTDVGDVKQVKKKKSAVKLKRDQEIEEFYQILNTYGGRAFIWRLIEQCGVYNAASPDLTMMTRGEGSRDIGLWVLNEVFTSKPEAYTIMRKEAVIRQGVVSRDTTEEGTE